MGPDQKPGVTYVCTAPKIRHAIGSRSSSAFHHIRLQELQAFCVNVAPAKGHPRDQRHTEFLARRGHSELTVKILPGCSSVRKSAVSARRSFVEGEDIELH